MEDELAMTDEELINGLMEQLSSLDEELHCGRVLFAGLCKQLDEAETETRVVTAELAICYVELELLRRLVVLDDVGQLPE